MRAAILQRIRQREPDILQAHFCSSVSNVAKFFYKTMRATASKIQLFPASSSVQTPLVKKAWRPYRIAAPRWDFFCTGLRRALSMTVDCRPPLLLCSVWKCSTLASSSALKAISWDCQIIKRHRLIYNAQNWIDSLKWWDPQTIVSGSGRIVQRSITDNAVIEKVPSVNVELIIDELLYIWHALLIVAGCNIDVTVINASSIFLWY